MAGNFTNITDKFLGLRESEFGETRIKKGESPKMKNLRVTPEYTLILRDGFEKLSSTEGEGRGIYAYEKGVIWVVDEKVYLRLGDSETVIGALESTTGEVSFFRFGGKIYILDGVKIKVWDGETFSDIEPYIPTIAISCDYTGAGTPFEEVNLLTGTKKQIFSGGNSSTYYLAEQNIDLVDKVYVNGAPVSKSKYTVNLENGSVTFSSSSNIDYDRYPNNIEIIYTKGNQSDLIHRMRFATSYGVDNDTRIFLWGDRENPNHIRYCGYHEGISSMDYFPELYFNKISSEYKVTSVARHYDGLMIFTEKEAFYTVGEKTTDASGNEYTVYPLKTVSTEIGCEAENFTKLIDNFPVTLSTSGLYRWRSSTIRDERNAEEIGERIKIGLGEMGVDGVHSFDRATESELYIWKGDKTYVYNYALDVFYYYEGFDAVAFCSVGTSTYFIRRDGALCKIIDDKLDDGLPIDFSWESNYEEGSPLTTKNVHSLEFEIYPVSFTSFSFVWVSEKLAGRQETLKIDYRVADFEKMNFDNLSFATASTSIKVAKRIKAKRIKRFKIILKGTGEGGDFHLLSLALLGKNTDTK